MEQKLERTAVAALASLGKRGRTTRIPDPVRQAVLAYVVEARKAGRPWSTIRRTLGLSEGVLRRWQRSGKKVPRPHASLLRPISIKPAPISDQKHLCLVTPSGMRLEGLTVESAAELLRRLA